MVSSAVEGDAMNEPTMQREAALPANYLIIRLAE